MTDRAPPPRVGSRRLLIAGAGIATLGVAAGCTGVASTPPRSSATIDDAAVLNNVLGLEYEAVAPYETALAGSPLGATDAAPAHGFQAPHAQHTQALDPAVLRPQGNP